MSFPWLTMTARFTLSFLWLLALPLAAAELRVSNRAPNPGEIGYRPADGASVRLNPPSFIWLHEKEARSYAIQWAGQEDFGDAATAEGLVWNTYTHREALKPGKYYWRYRFTTADGRQSGWSAVRTVVVPEEATAFPMPTRAEQRQRVPGGHPRLFMRPEDLPRLRALAGGELAAAFGTLRGEADRTSQAGPTPEPTQMGSARDKENKEAVKYWWPNREQTERACKEAETLAFVYLITQHSKYGEAARRWVLHLASWDPDGPTNFRLNCEAGTRDKQPQLAMLTVLVTYRAGQRPEWSAERSETETTLDVRIACDGKQTTVSFPQPGRGGAVRVEQP